MERNGRTEYKIEFDIYSGALLLPISFESGDPDRKERTYLGTINLT